jgi:hypothetical protein
MEAIAELYALNLLRQLVLLGQLLNLEVLLRVRECLHVYGM